MKILRKEAETNEMPYTSDVPTVPDKDDEGSQDVVGSSYGQNSYFRLQTL